MSVTQYWQQRLAAKAPLYSPRWKTASDFKPRRGQDRMGSWPHSVCREVMYQDYLIWHDEFYLSPYRGVKFWEDNLPPPVDMLTFWSIMAPWLYIAGKEIQVRSYLVPFVKQFEGRQVGSKRWRYFVRLCLWETHVAAFEMLSGVNISGNVRFFDAEKAKRTAEQISEFRLKIVETSKPAVGG